MHSTNYQNTFIEVAPDCPEQEGTAPAKLETVAGRQYILATGDPYSMTSDELLYEVHRQRTESGSVKSKDEFFSKPQACLRASPLAKQFGWGIHHNAGGKVAIFGVGTENYREFQGDETVKKVPAMRNKRAAK